MFTEKQIKRFWVNVDKNGETIIETRCWKWSGYKSGGYGQIGFNHKTYLAHRVSWIIYNNMDIPEGFFICHRCDNPQCTNPEHLFLGTLSDNMHDAAIKGRMKSKLKGKPLSDSHKKSLRDGWKHRDPHTYGMLGKTHSTETKKKLSKVHKFTFKGEKSYLSKFSDVERKEMYKFYNSFPQEKRRGLVTFLAKKYGVDKSTISNIVNDLYWAE